jgi:spermidine synthase
VARRVLLIAVLTGAVAIIAQSLIVRELLIACLGNELVIGFALGAWLLWTGVGAATLGRLAERSNRPARWLSAELLALAVALPGSLLLAVHGRQLVGLGSGELPGPLAASAVSLVALLPVSLVNGAVFPTLCRLRAGTGDDRPAVAPVYVAEAVGSAIGGVLFAAVLVLQSQPAFVILGCSLLAALLPPATSLVSGRALMPATVVAFAAAAALAVPARIDAPHVNTYYGRTTLRRHDHTASVYHSGVLAATYPPAAEAESLVHLALMQFPRPLRPAAAPDGGRRRVLLLGGLGGTANVLATQYATAQPAVDLVELDAQAVGFVHRHAPGLKLPARANVAHRDWRSMSASGGAAGYDAILVTLPNPTTAQINRYYTVEFFRQARRHLRPDGVLAFSVEATPSLGTRELRDFIACLHRTLAAVFADVAVVPGDHAIFLASASPDRLTLDPDTLIDRLGRWGVRPRAFADTAHGDLDPFRIEDWRAALDEAAGERLNTDLRPVAMSHALAVWSAKTRTPKSSFEQDLVRVPAGWFAAIASWRPAGRWAFGVGVLAAVCGAVALLRPARGAAAGLAVSLGGFTEITVEIVVLLAFQVFRGYLYAMLGMILASFMLGLCAGGALAGRALRDGRDPHRWLVGVQAALVLHPLVLAGALTWGAGPMRSAGALDAAFVAFAFIAGLVGGMQFPLATAVSRGQSVAARLSALDLCGAAVGAFLVSAVLIPALGLAAVTAGLSGLGLVGLVAVTRSAGGGA